MRPLRLMLVPAAVALSVACDPPVNTNEAPRVEFVNLTAGQTLNESPDAVALVRVTDIDADPLTLVMSADDGAVDLGTFADLTSGDEVSVSLATLTGGEHTLTASLSDGTATTPASLTFTWNLAPSAPVVEITPTDPVTGDDLVASVTTDAVDPEGTALIDYEIGWKRTADGATATDGTLLAAATEKGDEWTVTVRAYESSDGSSHADDAAFSEATASVVIGNTPPSAPALVAISPNDPLLVNDLRCFVPDPTVNGASDVDPADAATLTYFATWKLNGSLEPAYDGEDFLPAEELTTGASWSCSLRADDGSDRSSPVESAAVIVGSYARSAADAAARVSGDNADQHTGAVVLGVDLDDELSGQDDDLVLGVPDFREGISPDPAGLVAVFAGGDVASGLLASRTYSLLGVDERWPIGGRVLRLPDVLGDVGADLAFTRTSADGSQAGLVYVVPGNSLSTPANSPPYGGVILDGDTDPDFGSALGTGDLDGDDRSEVFVGDGGAALLFSGASIAAATNLTACVDPSHPCLQKGDAEKQFGTVTDIAIDAIEPGDYDGDGVDDILLTRSGALDDTIGFIFLGDAIGIGSTFALADADVRIDDDIDDGVQAGGSAASLADSDGDGVADFLIGNAGHLDSGGLDVGWVLLYRGGTAFGASSPLTTSASDVSIEGTEAGSGFGQAIVSLGDLGDDGLSEFAVAAPNAMVGPNAGAGIVYLFTGRDFTDAALGSQFARNTSYARAQVTGEDVDDHLTISGPPGDFDGDGVPDLVFGAPYWNASDFGRAYVFMTGE